jgi:DNA replication protein DnaC
MKYKNEEFTPCGKCENGYIYTGTNFPVATKCECLREYQNRQKLRLSLHKSNIPQDAIIDYTIRHYIKGQSFGNVKKLKFYTEHFGERFKDKQLYLWGEKGTQKTTLSFWMGKELIKKGYSVYYILMNDLVKDLQREGFEENEIDKYYDVDCLIIDRAFVADQVTLYKSGYQIPFLDNFLRKRIDQLQKATIFISNTHVNKIGANGFGEDIQDLITRKTNPFGLILEFKDHYTLKDDFDKINLWEE